MGQPLVTFQQVKKAYEGKDDKEQVVLAGVDFTIEEGEIFALIGPNGAGKTSLIKILLGLSKVTAGSIMVNGMKVGSSRKVKELIGYVPEKLAFPPSLTAIEVLKFYGRLRGVAKEERYLEALELVGLQEFSNHKVQTFSKGMTQRLGVAQALLARPRLIVLDEPTSGLDPVGVAQFKQLMVDLNREGLTILFTSHILSEVEQLAGRIAILSKGELFAVDTLEGLMNNCGLLPQLEIEFTGQAIDIPAVEKFCGKGKASLQDGHLAVTCAADEKIAILDAVRQAGGQIRDIRSREASLEDLFIRLLNKRNPRNGTISGAI